jgi:hypothetical protein
MLELASETTVKKNYLDFIKIYQFGANFSRSNFENLAPRIRSDFFSEFELYCSFFAMTFWMRFELSILKKVLSFITTESQSKFYQDSNS